MGSLAPSRRCIFNQIWATLQATKYAPPIFYLKIRNITSIAQAYNGHDENSIPNSSAQNQDTILLTKRLLNLSLRGEVDYARKIFDGLAYKDTVAWNAMIKGYVQNGMINSARELFDEMPERNCVSWNSMIVGYSQENMIHVAMKFFICMPGKDVFSWTAIITGLLKASCVSDAWSLFMEMPERNVVSWASIMSGFQHVGMAAETLSLFKEMLSSGVEPNSHSFTSALAASGDLAMLSMSKQLYLQLVKRGHENNSHIGNSIVSMFMKCGSYDDAKRAFVDLPHRNLVTWNAMITGYAHHGYGLAAIMTFHQMQKAQIMPDRISFLGVLQGCCHCGFVKEGQKYFQSMEKDFGIIPRPEHYACMTDLFARAGLLKEAYQVIVEMPFDPTHVFWRSLLNGCRIWGGFELGIYAANQLLRLAPAESSTWPMVMDVYASAGRSGQVPFLRKQMKEQETIKEMACSWVEIKGRTYLFTSRDETNLKSYEEPLHTLIAKGSCFFWVSDLCVPFYGYLKQVELDQRLQFISGITPSPDLFKL